MDVTIGPVSPHHWAAVATFVSDEREGLNIPDDWVDARTTEFLRASHSMGNDLFLVGESGDEVVGILILTRGKKHSDQHTAMLRIHLAEEARGAGLGGKMMLAGLKWADASGVKRIIATPYLGPVVEHDPVSKVRFFKIHGFEMEGFGRKAATLRDGSFTDVALMARVVE